MEVPTMCFYFEGLGLRIQSIYYMIGRQAGRGKVWAGIEGDRQWKGRHLGR